MKRRRALFLLAFGFLGLSYSLPQIRHWSSGAQGAVLLFDDETSYGARLRRAMEGAPGIGNPWISERAQDAQVIPTLPENLLAATPRVLSAMGLRIEPDAVLIASRALLPGILFLLLNAVLSLLGFGPVLAPVLAFWLAGEPGLMALKPFSGLFFKADTLPLARFLNPLLNLPLFLIATWLAGRAFLVEADPRRKILRALLAGAALGALFHVSIYYWTHLAAAVLVFAVISRSPGRWNTVGLGLLSATVVAFPYLLSALKFRSDPVSEVFAWRNGLLLADRGLYLLGHKALWVFALLSVPTFFSRDERDRFLSALVLGGLACYFSSLVTGISLQNFHWLYTLAPFLFAAAVRGVALASRRLPRFPRLSKRLLSSGGMLLVLLLAVNPIRAVLRWNLPTSSEPGATLGQADQDYMDAWDWLKRNADPRSVIVASEEIMELAPFRSGVRSLTSYHLVAEPMPSGEILERFQLSWWIEGIHPDPLAARLTPSSPPSVAQWIFGMTQAQEQSFRTRKFPSIRFEHTRELARAIADAQSKVSPGEAASLAAKLRIDWVLLGPRERARPRAEERAKTLFDLGPPIQAGQVRIYPVRGILSGTENPS